MLGLAATAHAATNDLTGLLQKGLFEEEANRNLDAAISNYQFLANAFDKDRQVAATAIFRLGECYRKLGRTNEAAAQYQRIVREFSDQQTLVTLSRQNLVGIGVEPENSATPATSDVLSRLMQQRQPQTEQPGFGPPITDEEEKEIRRIRVMIQNSPDLINAPSGNPELTPLGRAASLGQLRVAKFLLEAKADVNQKTGGMTPLQQAAFNGHRAMVDLLLANGADVNAKDSWGATALHIAAEHGFVSVAEALLGAKADINAQDPKGNTPLTLAVNEGFRPAAELLLSRGADPNLITTYPPSGFAPSESSMGTPLQFAVHKGDEPMVSLLLSNRANTEVRNPYNNQTTLEIAAGKGLVEIARRLLDAGANPNPDPKEPDDPGPLYRAVNSRKADMVSLLLTRGADPNGVNFSGKQGNGKPTYLTPLSEAANLNEEEIVTILLQNKADPNIKDYDGLTAFWHGFNGQGSKGLIPLLEHGADPNQPDNHGNSPLMGVAFANSFLSATDRVSVAKLLIAKGADINARDSQGNTALHLAVLHQRPELVALLLSSKADPNVRNQQGKTPLDLAKEAQRPQQQPGMLPANVLPIPPPPPPIRISGAPIPAGKPGGSGNPPENPMQPQDIVMLLRQHGAVDELPNFDAIRVTRQGMPSPMTVFDRPSNDWNQITLFDVLGVQYQLISRDPDNWNPSINESEYYTSSGNENNYIPFPDLAHIVVHRPSAEGNSSTELKINAARGLDSGDCAADVPLRFGDVVEIPEADHVMYAQWKGLETNELFNLKNCLTRHVEVTVKGKTTKLTIGPQIDIPGSSVREAEGNRLQVFLQRWQPVMLWPVLQKSKLLLASSDLSRIQVRRHDAATGKTHEWTVDCSNPQSRPNFWLRDGDVIEVPEKPGE